MIDQPLTLPDVATMLTVLTLVGGLWYRVETRVSSVSKSALEKAEKTADQLSDYKLEVAENYAKNGFIRDVEDRLGKRFDAIVDELHGMRQDFQNALMEAASAKVKANRQNRRTQ
jgi:hypothetical protein